MDDSGISVILANPPTKGGELVIREGRCEQSGGLWATVWPPLTLSTVAAYLERQNDAVHLFDCPVQEISDNDFLNQIEKIKPGLVVLNVSTPTLKHDLTFPTRIKKVVPECIVCAIGAHVSALPDQTLLQCVDLDLVIIGEPECTVCDLANTIKSKGNICEIDGIAFQVDGNVEKTPRRQFIADLEDLPRPAWHLLDLDLYRLPIYNRRFLMVSSGRGCPFNCSFCAAQTYYGRKPRYRSGRAVADEMIYARDNLGVSDFLFWTETFTLNKNQVQSLCQILINEDVNVRWTCNSRVDLIDSETLKLMKAAGCWMLSFGIESSSESVLAKAGKNITLEQIHRAVKLARDVGVEVTGHFVLGLPGETKESLNKTAVLSRRLKLDYAQFYCAVPFPGSRLYTEAESKNWIRKSDWSQFDQTIANMDIPGLSATDVMAARNRAIRDFYLQPRIIWRTLTRIRSWTEFKNLFEMFQGFLQAIR